jgi:hypothetical protein
VARSLDLREVSIIIFYFVIRIGPSVELVLREALLFAEISVMLESYGKLPMLTAQAFWDIATVKVSAESGAAESKSAYVLVTQPEQRQPAEISEFRLHVSRVKRHSTAIDKPKGSPTARIIFQLT